MNNNQWDSLNKQLLLNFIIELRLAVINAIREFPQSTAYCHERIHFQPYLMFSKNYIKQYIFNVWIINSN